MGINYTHAKSLKEFISTRYTVDDKGCWLWDNSLDKDGYGRSIGKWYRLHHKSGAHQLSYIAHKGPIEDGAIVCHTCDVRHCVNPDHLYAGTWQSNVQDCLDRGRYSNGAHKRRAFNETQIREIRNLRANGLKLTEIGDAFGIGFSRVSSICRRKAYKDVV